jgi:glycosyltransferase involved in cell wall biosynthesis
MKPIVSVIVPIYKTEKYLEKCLESIINQTLHEIEIICVDDCSPDRSATIVEEYSRRDNRISLIKHTENLGLGGARNTAIRASRADYIASVDSDDFILPTMIEKLWSATENGLYDVVVCGFESVDEYDIHISYNRPKARVIHNDNNEINIFNITNPAFWNKIWRRSLYVDNSIFFPQRVHYQDFATTPRILSKSRKIRFIDDVLYKYLIRPGSATYSMSAKHIIDYLKVFEVLRNFLVR